MFEISLDAGKEQIFLDSLNKAIVKFTESVATMGNDVVDLYDIQGNRMVRWVRQYGFYIGNNSIKM